MWVEVRIRGQWWRRKLRCVDDTTLVFHATQNPVGSRYKRTFTVGPRTEATRHFYAPHKGFVVVLSTGSRSVGVQNDELLVRLSSSVAGGQFMRCVADMAAALCKEDLACIRHGLTALSCRLTATMHAPKQGLEVSLPSLPVPRMDINLMAVGTWGDIAPLIEVGKALCGDGHRVRLATHACYAGRVHAAGLMFGRLAGDPSRLAQAMVER